MIRTRTALIVALLTTTLSAVAAPAQAAAAPAADMTVLEADCPRGPESYTVGPGSTGTAVREVQCLLNWALSGAASPSISIDGIYGNKTTTAVRTFQQCANNRGLGLTVDGWVGPATLPHLRWWAQFSYDTFGGQRIC
ncbi:peptidoglycan hydrolase-like protein with peptidoglycan-binding domain [Catenuloplanes nepalensis]|uniref:Peptidoglycan hydrolase-like protein with peptidoglycan-binding domain n=1 Tax=Catenuloplanes nepalensis TaxID=587533 RepID=A0ABT9MRR6_9ACTN|nr:peptidoglycan-binding domain-containing protein [Catenuloplanes nepalensis]MDP9794124.1 peptidoglycan hydrolase-like protein with peptidoglycan-binding domain [Catenuloplanes nepalensis]